MADNGTVPPSVEPFLNHVKKDTNEATNDCSKGRRRNQDDSWDVIRQIQTWKKQNIVSFVLITVNIVLIAVLLSITIAWRVRKDESHKPRQPELCVPASDLNEKSFCNKKTTLVDPKTCCGDASAVLNQLTKQAVASKSEENYYLKPLSQSTPCKSGRDVDTKPSAKLCGITPSSSAGNMHMVHWANKSDISFIKSGIERHDAHCLTIIQPGYYYIYSQIMYTDNGSSYHGNQAQSVHHYIFRSKNNGTSNGEAQEEKLLESTRSGCMVVGNTTNISSYIGAVFYMEEDDLVYVQVSHPYKLAYDVVDGNFFGVHMI